MERRHNTGWNEDDPADAPVPYPVRLWQREVHIPGIYDLEAAMPMEQYREAVLGQVEQA